MLYNRSCGSTLSRLSVDLDMGALIPYHALHAILQAWSNVTYVYNSHSFRYGAAYLKLVVQNHDLFRFSLGQPMLDDLNGRFDDFASTENRTLDPVPDHEALERAAKFFAVEYPTAQPLKLTRSWAGWIDYMPDALPVLGETPNIWGFSLEPDSVEEVLEWGQSAERFCPILFVMDIRRILCNHCALPDFSGNQSDCYSCINSRMMNYFPGICRAVPRMNLPTMKYFSESFEFNMLMHVGNRHFPMDQSI